MPTIPQSPSADSPPTHLLEFGPKQITKKSLRALHDAGFHYCGACQTVKSLSEFPPDPIQTSGIRSRCISCFRLYEPARKRHPEYRRKEDIQKKIHGHASWYATQQKKYTTVTRGIYVLRMQDIYKIGKSKRVYVRVAGLASLPYPVELTHAIDVTGDLTIAETTLHAMFQHCRLNGEWFRLSSDDLEQIKAIASL